MQRRFFICAAGAVAAIVDAGSVRAQDTVKVGLILPMTGPFASTGRQVESGVRLYVEQRGVMAGGNRIELIVRDDTGVADVTKRLAQELVVKDKVAILAGFGLTPSALAAAPIATEARVPQIIMTAGTSIITERSPFIVRTSFTLPQNTLPIAEWAAGNGIKTAVTLVTDYGPGLDAEKTFTEAFTRVGGTVSAKVRVPLRNPDFAPFLQRAADARPNALFVFVPAGFGAAVMKQFAGRGLDKAGVQLIGTGDVTDDDSLNDMGDAALGTITSHHYSAAHDSPENNAFVEAFRKVTNGMRPNFSAVAGWDGMHLIYQALAKTGGKTDGEALVNAMRGMAWISPRGPISIDQATRDIIQNVYVRKVEWIDGQLYNVEFATFKAVKDPGKAK